MQIRKQVLVDINNDILNQGRAKGGNGKNSKKVRVLGVFFVMNL